MRLIVTFLIICLFTYSAYTQDSIVGKTIDKPVKDIFETGLILDQQTVVGPAAKSFNFIIQHRFGLIDNGLEKLYGLYSPSTIRLGLDVGITDRIMIGLGTTNYRMLQDINWKIAILRQTRSGRIPLSVSYFGNMVIDAQKKETFGKNDDYKFMHRLSFFHQLIFSRKFSDRFSFQAASSLIYYNAVWENFDNIYYDLSAAARVKLTDNFGINLGYNHPVSSGGRNNYPGLAGGIEIGTSTHAFQLFATNYRFMLNQYNSALILNPDAPKSYKDNEIYMIDKGEFLIGMNITVRF